MACTPLNTATTMPAVVLGAIDMSNKRKVWHDYALDGDVYAQYELARSYCCNSEEGPIDLRQAMRWFCTAARNGYAKAQYDIGQLYEGASELEGMSVSQDKMTAFMWYSLAARRVHPEAMKRKKLLREALSEEERMRAELLLVNPDTDTLKCGK